MQALCWALLCPQEQWAPSPDPGYQAPHSGLLGPGPHTVANATLKFEAITDEHLNEVVVDEVVVGMGASVCPDFGDLDFPDFGDFELFGDFSDFGVFEEFCDFDFFRILAPSESVGERTVPLSSLITFEKATTSKMRSTRDIFIFNSCISNIREIFSLFYE